MAGQAQPTALSIRVLALPPEDGTPVLDRVVRAIRAREGEPPVDADRYFKALDELSAAARISLLCEPDQADILVDRVRKAAAPAIVDGFLKSRLSPAKRASLGNALRETAP